MVDIRTRDGYLITIAKGGQQLPDNTYGFEIEFCSHDSSAFAFTHVDVAQIGLLWGNPQAAKIWRVETDSGNVLELVTDPLVFQSVDIAYEYKRQLAAAMVSSCVPQGGPPGGIGALTLQGWAAALPGVLAQFAVVQQVQFASWAAVGAQLTMENVDDGINIRAGLMRHQNNQNTWQHYVEQTIVARSEKDWGQGFSSQVNMPMELEGYFLYFWLKKRPRAEERVQAILQGDLDDLEDTSDSTVEKNVTTWFWRSLIASVFTQYVTALNGPTALGADDFSRMSRAEIKFLGLMFVATQKILTGALGKLSEPPQLALQQYAWNQRSTQAMTADSPSALTQLKNTVGVDTLSWLEYHSAMKDLTGLWFKAALFDVVDKEVTSQQWVDVMVRFGEVLAADHGRFWASALEERIRFMKSQRWEALWSVREDYFDNLEALDWRDLAIAIASVEAALAGALGNDVLVKRRNNFQSTFVLPPFREFLHYAEAPPWEGRYDTMVAAISRGEGWVYLIEHRFN